LIFSLTTHGENFPKINAQNTIPMLKYFKISTSIRFFLQLLFSQYTWVVVVRGIRWPKKWMQNFLHFQFNYEIFSDRTDTRSITKQDQFWSKPAAGLIFDYFYYLSACHLVIHFFNDSKIN
jgi:hypothetical protein